MNKRVFVYIAMLFFSFQAFSQTPYNVVMTLYNDPTTQMAFNWFTTSNTTSEQVQIATGTVTDPNIFLQKG